MDRRWRKSANWRGKYMNIGGKTLGDDEILIGDYYAQFCPSLLEEVTDQPVVVVPKMDPTPKEVIRATVANPISDMIENKTLPPKKVEPKRAVPPPKHETKEAPKSKIKVKKSAHR